MDFGNLVSNLLGQMAFFHLSAGNYIMIGVALVFLYLAIAKGFEPLLLIPIAFGMLLVNIYPDIMYSSGADFKRRRRSAVLFLTLWMSGAILPSLIFMGVGAMTDFGPLIANPISFLMGAAAQFGIYCCIFLCNLVGILMIKQQLLSPSSVVQTALLPFSFAGKLGQTQHYGTDRCCSIFLYGSGADHPAADYEAILLRKKSVRSRWTSFVRYPSWRRSCSRSSLPSLYV